MKEGDKIKVIYKNKQITGYFQYIENNVLFISSNIDGMYSIGIMKEDIKEIKEV